MPISVWIENLAFSGGKSISLKEGSTTIIVGPNNGGKTSTLREIMAHVAGSGLGPVLSSVSLQKRGNSKDLEQWLNLNVAKVVSDYDQEYVYSWWGNECRLDYCKRDWDDQKLGRLAQILASYLSVDERLTHLQPGLERDRRVDAYNVLKDAPRNPIHVLFKNEEIEKRVSSLSSSKF